MCHIRLGSVMSSVCLSMVCLSKASDSTVLGLQLYTMTTVVQRNGRISVILEGEGERKILSQLSKIYK